LKQVFGGFEKRLECIKFGHKLNEKIVINVKNILELNQLSFNLKESGEDLNFL